MAAMNLNSYPVPPWTEKDNWKETIRTHPYVVRAIIRDGYKCADCHNGAVKLYVHHIDESRKTGNLNNDINNLVTLCRSCHAARHGQNLLANRIAIKLRDYFPDKRVHRGELTLVANELGVSRERVRQIANKLKYTAANEVYRQETARVCEVCGKVFFSKRRRKYCSGDCYKKHLEKYWTTVFCKECGRGIRVLKSYVSIGRAPTFCGKVCQGKFLGKHYGIGRPKTDNV